MKGGENMNLNFRAYTSVSNKMLVMMSGLGTMVKDDQEVPESTHFQIPMAYRAINWSNSLIRQTLAYLFLVDSKGQSLPFLESEIASYLNVSTRTVQKNNKTLSDCGLIKWSRLLGDIISVQFTDYLFDVLDLRAKNNSNKSDWADFDLNNEDSISESFYGGRGYTRLSVNNLKELLSIKDINSLRFSLRIIAMVEIEYAKNKLNQEFYLGRSFFDRFAKSYLNTKNKIKAALRLVRGFFDCAIFDNVKEISDHFKSLGLSQRNRINKDLLKNGFLVKVSIKQDEVPKEVYENEISVLKRVIKDVNDAVSLDKNVIKPKYSDLSSLLSSYGVDSVQSAIKYAGRLLTRTVSHTSDLLNQQHLIMTDPGLGLRIVTEKYYKPDFSK